MSLTTSLSDRMKEYESQTTQLRLMKKLPVIIRLDGIGFSKFTKGFDKPFDEDLSEILQKLSLYLIKEISGARFIYSQSDEISILLTDWDHTKETDGGRIDTWYDYRVQKLTSVVSAKATAKFNELIAEKINDLDGEYILAKLYDMKTNVSKEDSIADKIETKQELLKRKLFKGCFDARAFNLPLDEVTNYFIFRQQDALRNSISSYARSFFSTKQLTGVSNPEKIEMVKEEYGKDFNDVSQLQKVGFSILSTEEGFKLDKDIPMFVENRDYIERYL